MPTVPNPTPLRAGRDCTFQHECPPRAICNEHLCQEWLALVSKPQQCSDKHSHLEHYTVAANDKVTFCTGRLFCDAGHVH